MTIPHSTITSKKTEIDHESGSVPLIRVLVVRGTRSVRRCAVSYLPVYVCVHETFIKADIFISLFFKDSTFLFVFRFQWKGVFQLTLEGHMQTLNFK